MPFATDRDLLALEPNLFRDAGWLGQRLVKGTANIAGSNLTFTSQDVGLDAAGVAAGDVVTAAGVSYEILSRTSSAVIVISRLRDLASDPGIPPAAGTGLDTSVYSFSPQIAMVHRQLLRMLGIEPTAGIGVVGESSVTNPDALRLVEAYGALAFIYTAASVLAGSASPAAQRLELYRRLFAEERQHAAAAIDLDGDGVPDATRRLNTIQLMRA